MLKLIRVDTKERIGGFRSYANIGKYLKRSGKVGVYYVLPNNAVSIASMRTIKVTKDKYGKQVEMEGAIY